MSGVMQFPESVLVAYPTKGKASAFIVPPNRQCYVYNARAFNNSGGDIDVGICRNHISSQFDLLLLTGGGTVATEVSNNIAGGVDLFSGVADDGFVIQDKRRFNMIGVTVVTGAATGVYAVQYWNGSAWTALATLEVGDFANSASDEFTVFRAPSDWVVGGPAGLDPNMYSVRIVSTTAPDDPISADNLWVAEFLDFYNEVPNNAAVQLSFPDSKPFLLLGGEGLFPYFDTAAAANQFGCYFNLV